MAFKPQSTRSIYSDNNLPKQVIADELIAYQIRPPTNEVELYNYVYRVLGVKIPTAQVCPNCVAPWTAFKMAYFAESPVQVWRASRGAGKTFLLALLALTELLTLNAFVVLLGGSLEQSIRVHDYINGKDPSAKGKFLESKTAPTWMLDGEPTATRTKLTSGGKLIALTASDKSVRGLHPSRLRLDEVDAMDLKIYGPAMAMPKPFRKKGKLIIPVNTVLSSTHNVTGGTFSYVMDQARDNSWPFLSWCWRESLEPHGWMAQEDIESLRAAIPKHIWEREMEHREPKADDAVFDPELVHDRFDKDLDEFEGEVNEECVYEEPDGYSEYYHGVDLAKSKDSSIILTFKRSIEDDIPDVCVAYKRMQRCSYVYIAREIDKRVEEYGGHCIYDGGGPGKVVEDLLSCDAEKFEFSDKKEAVSVLANYVEAFEQGRVKYPMIKHMWKEHLELTFQMLYGGSNHHLPDTVCAAALAWRARESTGDIFMGRLNLR